jgi:UDP-N-acetyl-D-mannosaminuronic acid dehydrogenase
MKICVVGLGYMGLPTALFLSRGGHIVIGYDISKSKIEMLKNGNLPFEETGLKELYEQGKSGFSVSSKLEQVDAYLIAVPTPANKDNTCDLKYVISAAESVVRFIKKGVLVILESTVSPGTTVGIVRNILEKSGLKAGKDFSLAYVSEKAIPGNTLHEMVHNDRVMGGIDKKSNQMAKEIYASFVKGEIHVTDCTTAETVKLIENAYRDVNIAFANELARICEKLGLDVWETIKLANHHPRVKVLSPGPGVGGHCLSTDPWFLTEKYGNDGIIGTARDVNEKTPMKIIELMESMIKGKPVIAMLGASYKKNVDDFRESPTLRMISICKEKGYNFKVTDPFVKGFPEQIFSFEDAIKGANIILVAVDHDIYKQYEQRLSELKNMGVRILDTRNLFNGKFPRIGAVKNQTDELK